MVFANFECKIQHTFFRTWSFNPLSSRSHCFLSSMTFSRWVRRSWSSSCNFSLSTGAADLLILPPDSNTCLSSDFYKQRIKDIYKQIKSKKKRFYTCDNNSENDKISLNERDSFKIGLISKVQPINPKKGGKIEVTWLLSPFTFHVNAVLNLFKNKKELSSRYLLHS